MIAGRLLLTAALVVAPSVAPTKKDDYDVACLKQRIASCDELIQGTGWGIVGRGWCYLAVMPSCLLS